MSEFKYFRHVLTGKVGRYPENFGDLFSDTFIEVDSDAADCVDCWLKPEDEVNDEDFVVNFDDDDDDDFPDPVVALSDEKKDK
jgi:hypothetical protein